MAAILRGRNSNDVYKHSVLCTRGSDGGFQIIVKPKEKGEYKLSVFGRKINSGDASFYLLVNYFLSADEVEENFNPFPEHFGVWGANSMAGHCGFTPAIEKFDVLACRSGEIYMKLPVSRLVQTKSVVRPAQNEAGGDLYQSEAVCNQSTLNQYSRGVVHVRTRLPKIGFYSLCLFAQYHDPVDNSTGYVNVANFFINCQNSSLTPSPYPRTFPMTQCFECLLLEPLVGELLVNEQVRFVLKSPLLTKATIGREVMLKGQGDPDDDVWWLVYTPKCSGKQIFVYGSVEEDQSSLTAIYMFSVVGGEDDVVTVSTHM
ncbi:uncharacterized protein LOC131938988 [Physella acuta]|uniref:uncharacterized protein LOC131938988 n=1 Tax=Physella acuta TaxID=109671 RepID=UPI0027DD6415|nr:uncharacterized protein LOC131938988 [Physella acuta]